jgi:hypothetical protein
MVCFARKAKTHLHHFSLKPDQIPIETSVAAANLARLDSSPAATG